MQGREDSAASHLRTIWAYVLQEFCKVILKHKAATAKDADEADTIDAFVALGGKPDKTGQISSEKLRATIKVTSIPVGHCSRERDLATLHCSQQYQTDVSTCAPRSINLRMLIQCMSILLSAKGTVAHCNPAAESCDKFGC